MNTPTPKTDERKASFALDTIRQLETELATVTGQRDGLRSAVDYVSDQLSKITEQREERQAISKDGGSYCSHQRRERWIKTSPLKTSAELETELATVTEQRDEARREAEKYRNLITNVKGWKYDLPWEKPDAVKGGNHES